MDNLIEYSHNYFPADTGHKTLGQWKEVIQLLK